MSSEEILEHLDAIGKGAYSTFDTLQNSYDSALYCIDKKIEGDFVECGVGAGAQISAMALACKVRNTPERKIYAFDSYKGIPMGSSKDTSQPAIHGWTPPPPDTDPETLLVSSGITVHSLENVQNNLIKWGVMLNADFIFPEGWFQHTLPEWHKKIDKIAILRLDGDMYESTKVCLEFLFPKLVSGGILIIDDWALTGARLACDEYLKNYEQLGEINHIPNTTPVWFYKK